MQSHHPSSNCIDKLKVKTYLWGVEFAATENVRHYSKNCSKELTPEFGNR